MLLLPHAYGAGTLQGYLRTKSVNISVKNINKILKESNPTAFTARKSDTLNKTNPTPYLSPSFGYKGHIDQNEKLVMVWCMLFSGMDLVVLSKTGSPYHQKTLSNCTASFTGMSYKININLILYNPIKIILLIQICTTCAWWI